MINHLYTNIGDFTFLLKCNNTNLASFLKKHYDFGMKDFHQSHMTVEINSDFGVPFLNYDVTVQKHFDKITYNRADYYIEVNLQFTEAAISVYDDLALKHALMNLFSAFLVHQKWGLLVHSSCAIEDGKAHLFAGHSGAGKSTAAKLSHPRELLSDEASILKIEEGGVTVYNSPFRSELEIGSGSEPCPLASIQLLHQAINNARLPLNKPDALIHLIDKVFYWPYNPGEASTIIELLIKMVKTVPVYNLYFQKNNSFWELIS